MTDGDGAVHRREQRDGREDAARVTQRVDFAFGHAHQRQDLRAFVEPRFSLHGLGLRDAEIAFRQRLAVEQQLAAAQAAGATLGNLRQVYFSAGDAPVRARKAEAALMAGDLDAAVAALSDDLSPPADLESSSAVKLHLAGVLLRRVARQLQEQRS